MSSLKHAIVIYPVLPDHDDSARQADARLEEAVGLTLAIHLKVTHSRWINVSKPRPATLLGLGVVQELKEFMDNHPDKPGIVIIDSALSPVQHRNLEKEWGAKVLDRTALILEIFGERAQTKEGTLQVELAHLTYQRSRLVRSWTHLERQRGGAGFLGGPGERQIESDRRMLANKITRLKKQLEAVKRTRELQRRRRKRAPSPVIALVGYTNAGKSTLFNQLTDSEVTAQDQLFATLDPTMRAVILPSSERIIFSDTVGFISNLPTQLVAAFRATLEEVLEADIVLHVRDISHPDTDAQKQDVLSVLEELGLGQNDQRPVLEIWNKTDLLEPEDLETLKSIARAKNEKCEGTLSDPFILTTSAFTGEGLNGLYAELDRIITARYEIYVIELPLGEGAALAWLHSHGEVLHHAVNQHSQEVFANLSPKTAGQFEKAFDQKITLAKPEEVLALKS